MKPREWAEASRLIVLFVLVAKVLDEPATYFILVDKSHALAPDHEPDDFVNLTAYPLSVLLGDLLVCRAVMPAVLELASVAKAEGVTLVFSSGYRSFEYQKFVYAREVTAPTYSWARKSTRPNRKRIPAPPISTILRRSVSRSS
jgi:D-alanyl-D-alanine carboxypeptidase.